MLDCRIRGCLTRRPASPEQRQRSRSPPDGRACSGRLGTPASPMRWLQAMSAQPPREAGGGGYPAGYRQRRRTKWPTRLRSVGHLHREARRARSGRDALPRAARCDLLLSRSAATRSRSRSPGIRPPSSGSSAPAQRRDAVVVQAPPPDRAARGVLTSRRGKTAGRPFQPRRESGPRRTASRASSSQGVAGAGSRPSAVREGASSNAFLHRIPVSTNFAFTTLASGPPARARSPRLRPRLASGAPRRRHSRSALATLPATREHGAQRQRELRARARSTGGSTARRARPEATAR
jgi:hypothetical protein